MMIKLCVAYFLGRELIGHPTSARHKDNLQHNEYCKHLSELKSQF